MTQNPYIGYTNSTLKGRPVVHAGDAIACPHCGEAHTLESCEEDGQPSEMLLFYNCGERLCLAAVDNCLVIGITVDVSGNITP